ARSTPSASGRAGNSRRSASFFRADPRFGAGEEPADVSLVAPDEKRGNARHHEQHGVARADIPGEDGRQQRGHHRGERGIAEEYRDHAPGGEAAQAEPDIEAEQHARRCRDALAALEAVKQREKVPQKYREPGERRGLRRIKLGEPDREPAFPRVAAERENGGGPLSRA